LSGERRFGVRSLAFLSGRELEAASRLFSETFTLYVFETILRAMCSLADVGGESGLFKPLA